MLSWNNTKYTFKIKIKSEQFFKHIITPQLLYNQENFDKMILLHFMRNRNYIEEDSRSTSRAPYSRERSG